MGVNARAVTLESDGLRLEGRMLVPEGALGGVVLCHPHPRHQGSMSSILIPLLQRALGAVGWASLRFNFRGVGRSEGRFDRGIGEARDVSAALDLVALEVPDLPLAVAGWSFGSMAALAGAAGDARVRSFVAIAPPVTSPSTDLPAFPPPERLREWGTRVLAICGDRDDFCSPERTRAWAAEISPDAEVRIIEGADHFFTGARDELLALVIGSITR